MPDGRRTKILWITAEQQKEPLRLEGVLALGSERISQELRGSQNFPSIINIPEPGCWTLTLSTSSSQLGSISLRAVPS